jgi:hypothetical protein
MVTNKPKLSSKELPVTDKATSNSKININFEIKNLNIFKANANHSEKDIGRLSLPWNYTNLFTHSQKKAKLNPRCIRE